MNASVPKQNENLMNIYAVGYNGTHQLSEPSNVLHEILTALFSLDGCIFCLKALLPLKFHELRVELFVVMSTSK